MLLCWCRACNNHIDVLVLTTYCNDPFLLYWCGFQYLLIFAVPTTLSYINIGIQSRFCIPVYLYQILFALLLVTSDTSPDFPVDHTWCSFLIIFQIFLLTFTLLFITLSLPLPCFTPHYFHLLSSNSFRYFYLTCGFFHFLSCLLLNLITVIPNFL